MLLQTSKMKIFKNNKIPALGGRSLEKFVETRQQVQR
jgi:hypothetical protein